MADIRSYISHRPFFLALLPLFFVLHAGIENYRLEPFFPALEVFIIYLIVAAFLVAGFWLVFRNIRKAALMAFLLLCINFFFGAFHDFLKIKFPGSMVSNYSFLLPLILMVIIITTWLTKRSKSSFKGISKFLNLLFLVLILIDLVNLISLPKIERIDVNKIAFQPIQSKNKPDIYLLIADEYAGNTQLKEIFNFDNGAFENELRKRNFMVAEEPRSNYNATMYSMASLLNMQYLDKLDKPEVNHAGMYDCGKLIKNSSVTDFFNSNGYEIINHSIFDLYKNDKLVDVSFFPTKKQMITSQTLVDRFFKDLGYHFLSKDKLARSKKRILENNNLVFNETIKTAKQKSTRPKFVYSHFILPHYPYYFDSSGKEVTARIMEEENKLNQADYLSYLKYSNKKLLQLVDEIIYSSSTPPVILLMSDHGFRQFTKKVDKEYYFMNLNAVLLPGRNYEEFYKGISNVNQFRIVLNAAFNQQLPLLKDSTIFLWEGK